MIKCWIFVLLKLFRVDTERDVLRQTIFENALLPLNRKPLFFKSFSKGGLKRISNKWDYHNKTFLHNIAIHNKLQNKRNCISECSKIKTSVPKELVEKFKTLDTCTNKRKFKLCIDNNLFFVTVRIKLFSIKMLDYKLLKKNC